MPAKHCLLVQTHTDIGYFIALAHRQPELNIYVHIDAKATEIAFCSSEKLPNLFLLKNRVAVHWGGFSQIQATLHLFEAAFANPDNQFFHLVSGEDVVLQEFDFIEQNWKKQNFAMMITCQLAPQYAYRFISDSLHADTAWQRSLAGKMLTKAQQAKAKMQPYQLPVYFGSQWFSVTREDWVKILPVVADYRDFFAKKLVPDEHFFQTLIQEKLFTVVQISNYNQRFIIFDKNIHNGNSPLYLNVPQLEKAKQQGFWFARKVKKDIAMHWLEHSE